MSCEECERIQELNLKSKKCAYLRVDIASVLIGACDEHFAILRSALLQMEGLEDRGGTIYRVTL